MAATRTRFTLLRLMFSLSIITYIDRVCISTAATDIRTELGLTSGEMGWVFSAFVFAYALFEIPSGWLGDVLGPRKVLARIVLWWSGFTAATGMVWNYGSLLVARFLFGAGEAGAFPNMSSWAMCHDIGAEGAGTVTGCMNTFGNVGGSLSPLVVGYAVQWWGSWTIPLLIASGVAVLGGLLTLLIDTRKPLAA